VASTNKQSMQVWLCLAKGASDPASILRQVWGLQVQRPELPAILTRSGQLIGQIYVLIDITGDLRTALTTL
jgi:DamX protein